MPDFRADQPWRLTSVTGSATGSFFSREDPLVLLGLLVVFWIASYLSVGAGVPSSVPVHHDDYTNYAAAASQFHWSSIRPLSSALIYLLSFAGPEWLIGAVRLLTVTYVWLIWKLWTVIERPRYPWLVVALFGVIVFSSPITAEYARYTGMITHLVSGSLGILAVLCVFAGAIHSRTGMLNWSVALVVLSVLAKEDFVVLYAVSVLIAAMANRSMARGVLGHGIPGVLLCLTLVGGTKLFTASSFIGVASSASSYYVSLAPISVIKTMTAYLLGAGHPAMQIHGQIIAASFVLVLLVAVGILLRYKRVSWATYFAMAAGAVVFPYSLLPNHVNAYYELIWLPFIVVAIYISLAEILTRAIPKGRERSVGLTIATLFVSITLIAAMVDLPGRRSIAAWYDNVAVDNSRVLNQLAVRRAEINAAESVCVVGVNQFSPWYMHGGAYLDYVLGVSSQWRLIVADESPLYPGFQLAANGSGGRIKLVPPEQLAAESCLVLNL